MTQAAEAHTNGAAKPPRPGCRPWPDVCSELRRKVSDLLRLPGGDDAVLRDTQLRVRESLAVIGEALQKYGTDQLSLSYNGGKDCLVLLILLLACLPDPARPLPDAADGPAPGPVDRLQAVYIAPPDPFPEVEDFVAVSTSQYHLDLTRYALPMRAALEAYRADRPPVKAIFMGTRRSDPHSEFLTPFSPTDGDWPRFMRVNPVLDWNYPEIWTFIRALEIPFCSLYNRGFTSLGGTKNTRPNPALVLDDGAGAKTFRPAYELVCGDEERLGRNR